MTDRLREGGVTFCIPNWNHRTFLPRSVGSAIRTVRALERAGFAGEVVVVDDASRDGSQRALASMALMQTDGVLDVILSPVNQGLPATRMKGIERARFRWVCLLDADNELIPENFLRFWQAAVLTSATLTYGNLLVRQEGRATRLLSNDMIDETICEGNYVDAFCIIEKERFFDLGGYRTDLKTHEDWELLLHLIAEGQDIVFVPLVVGYYYVEDASMVQTVSVDHHRFRRMFNQRRVGLPLSFKSRRMYRPEVGWI